MAKRFSAERALQLILEETEASDGEIEEEVSEYEDHISENSESDSHSEDPRWTEKHNTLAASAKNTYATRTP